MFLEVLLLLLLLMVLSSENFGFSPPSLGSHDWYRPWVAFGITTQKQPKNINLK